MKVDREGNPYALWSKPFSVEKNGFEEKGIIKESKRIYWKYEQLVGFLE